MQVWNFLLGRGSGSLPQRDVRVQYRTDEQYVQWYGLSFFLSYTLLSNLILSYMPISFLILFCLIFYSLNWPALNFAYFTLPHLFLPNLISSDQIWISSSWVLCNMIWHDSISPCLPSPFIPFPPHHSKSCHFNFHVRSHYIFTILGECPAGYYCPQGTSVPLSCPHSSFSLSGSYECVGCPGKGARYPVMPCQTDKSCCYKLHI